ncbi:MAG: hypothetical protein WCP23_05670 [Planctomycetota bacterium]|jgi:spermidine synthase|nr:hypothetical protein [Planctomycetia bacterium]
MKKTNLLDHTTTVDGKPMTLHEHDGVVMIRIDGQELMSTRQHDSEERIAQLACAHITPPFPGACVLIGGLGLGFTLRAALKSLAADAAVLVAEIMPAVIQWNLNAQYNLGRDAMADPRVNMIQADVADVLHQSPGRFDSIILDIDNGASGMSVQSNSRLYEAAGLQMARSALKAHGCLAVWSASDDPAFVQRMRQCGFRVTVERARTHPTGNAHNALFIGRVP